MADNYQFIQGDNVVAIKARINELFGTSRDRSRDRPREEETYSFDLELGLEALSPYRADWSPINIDDKNDERYIKPVPLRFCCPISLEIMNHPVFSQTRNDIENNTRSYERQSLSDDINRPNYNFKSPTSSVVISIASRVAGLIANEILESEITAWKTKYIRDGEHLNFNDT
jgi:hypothetical protein